MSPVWKGRWTARVEQDFEVEVDTEQEARDKVEMEMQPQFVELMDMEIENIREEE